MNRTDSELVSAYVDGGDQQAFSLLLSRHQERVFGYLMGMVRDRATAEDLFQETFIRAIRAMRSERASYDARGKWLPWIMRIARNAALDHLRSRKRRNDRTVYEEEDGFEIDQMVAHDGPGPDVSLQQSEMTAFIRACIDRLPEEQREVLLLRHETEMTFREIAETTDCSINTALGRMRYALLNLRKMMKESDIHEIKRVELAS